LGGSVTNLNLEDYALINFDVYKIIDSVMLASKNINIVNGGGIESKKVVVYYILASTWYNETYSRILMSSVNTI
jgi:hypothetical protein